MCDSVEKTKKAFQNVQKYQQDWKEHDVDRVNLYYKDVEGDWLDEFDTVDPKIIESFLTVMQFLPIVDENESVYNDEELAKL